MTIWTVLLGAALTGIAFGQVLRFQRALARIAEGMAAFEDSGQPPITYQNSITPPWVIKTWLLLALAVIGLVVAGWYVGGLRGAFVSLGAAIGGSLFFSGLSALISRPKETTYFAMAFHSLANRSANFRRDGDHVMADAAEHFCTLMMTALKLADHQAAAKLEGPTPHNVNSPGQ